MYLPNKESKYMGQKLTELQGKIDESIIIVGDFNILLSEKDRPSKDIIKLINTSDQLDIMDIY